jgi:hypothetical protein
MKLYTEEEIKRLLKEQIIFDDDDFDKLTPIELPSDEEIDGVISQINGEIDEFDWGFLKGAKWMRDKIQGGNNE